MIRRLNRAFQDYMREKRLKFGKYIWDRKEKKEEIKEGNFIEKNSINSILFLRYDGKIGDMVINTIMFREIKKQYPNIKIGVVTKGGTKGVIEDNPYVDKIYNYEKSSKKIKELAKEISNEKYDLLIDFSEMLRVNQMMLINLCKAGYNMGLDRKDWQLFDISVDSGIDFQWTEHITQRYLAYLLKLGLDKEKINLSYDIYLKKDNSKYSDFLNNIVEEKKVVLNPYGASKHKSFSLETLDKIIKYLKELNIGVILIYFGDKYKELEVLKKDNKNLYIPKEILDIEDSAYLISKGDFVITPDTSIVHIASALKKANISVYPPKGGKFGVDHLVWAPKTEGTNVIFCRDKESKYDEIDINTFNFEEMKELINNLSRR